MVVLSYGGVPTATAQTDPEPTDSTLQTDSALAAESLIDSTLFLDSAYLADSLGEAKAKLLEFEDRYRARLDEERKRAARQISAFDTLIAYFGSPRLNHRERVEQSFFHDPGDYLKFDPSAFVSDFEVTPMRKTVQPFGLLGDRLDVIHDGWPIRPFEHVPEPDGLIDLNDVPSALDDDVLFIPGAGGRLFGGGHSAATLVTRPDRPEDFTPRSAFIVDKGSFAYSYARGRYSKLFSGGRFIDFSLGYRKTDGPRFGFIDDSYHYFGDIYFPVSEQNALLLTGHLYNRDGQLAIRPDAGGSLISRGGNNSSFRAGVVRHNKSHTGRYELGYTHARHSAFLGNPYRGDFDQTANGGYISSVWMAGHTLIRAEASADYTEYVFGVGNELKARTTGAVDGMVAFLSEGGRLAFQGGGEYVEDFDFLPNASVVYTSESDKFFVFATAGYSERAPSLHELYLPFKELSLYNLSSTDYADQGNPDLKKEKHVIGSLDMEIGSRDTNLGFRVAGGKVYDGIDWQVEKSASQNRFTPQNGDIDFLSTSGHVSLRLADFLRFRGGASWRKIEYELNENPAYSPELQAFSGLELHVYWPQRLIHFFAYGEIVYTGEYDGYDKKGLGKDPILNVKLSFEISSFRFHYIFQNIVSREYEQREYFRRLGRYNYWGFVWNFLN
jgi:hypothetical protein